MALEGEGSLILCCNDISGTEALIWIKKLKTGHLNPALGTKRVTLANSQTPLSHIRWHIVHRGKKMTLFTERLLLCHFYTLIISTWILWNENLKTITCIPEEVFCSVIQISNQSIQSHVPGLYFPHEDTSCWGSKTSNSMVSLSPTGRMSLNSNCCSYHQVVREQNHVEQKDREMHNKKLYWRNF